MDRHTSTWCISYAKYDSHGSGLYATPPLKHRETTDSMYAQLHGIHGVSGYLDIPI